MCNLYCETKCQRIGLDGWPNRLCQSEGEALTLENTMIEVEGLVGPS